MKLIYASILAIASLAAAQSNDAASAAAEGIKMIPACALSCLTQGIGNSTCTATDAYCQCTSGAQDIAKVVGPCLCAAAADGTCSADELKQANEATAKICEASLSAKGETFSAAPAVDQAMCQRMQAGSDMGGAMSSMSSSASAPMSYATPPSGGNNMTSSTPPTSYGGSNTTTNTSTGTGSGASPSGSAPISSTGGAAGVGAIDSFRLLTTCGFLGVAGVALFAL